MTASTSSVSRTTPAPTPTPAPISTPVLFDPDSDPILSRLSRRSFQWSSSCVGNICPSSPLSSGARLDFSTMRYLRQHDIQRIDADHFVHLLQNPYVAQIRAKQGRTTTLYEFVSHLWNVKNFQYTVFDIRELQILLQQDKYDKQEEDEGDVEEDDDEEDDDDDEEEEDEDSDTDDPISRNKKQTTSTSISTSTPPSSSRSLSALPSTSSSPMSSASSSSSVSHTSSVDEYDTDIDDDPISSASSSPNTLRHRSRRPCFESP